MGHDRFTHVRAEIPKRISRYAYRNRNKVIPHTGEPDDQQRVFKATQWACKSASSPFGIPHNIVPFSRDCWGFQDGGITLHHPTPPCQRSLLVVDGEEQAESQEVRVWLLGDPQETNLWVRHNRGQSCARGRERGDRCTPASEGTRPGRAGRAGGGRSGALIPPALTVTVLLADALRADESREPPDVSLKDALVHRELGRRALVGLGAGGGAGARGPSSLEGQPVVVGEDAVAARAAALAASRPAAGEGASAGRGRRLLLAGPQQVPVLLAGLVVPAQRAQLLSGHRQRRAPTGRRGGGGGAAAAAGSRSSEPRRPLPSRRHSPTRRHPAGRGAASPLGPPPRRSLPPAAPLSDSATPPSC